LGEAEFVTLGIVAPEELEEELVARLYALGGAGSWSEPARGAGAVRIHAFFASGSAPDPGSLSTLELPGVEIGRLETVEARDWAAAWREGAQPIEVGARFLVDPRERSHRLRSRQPRVDPTGGRVAGVGRGPEPTRDRRRHRQRHPLVRGARPRRR